MRSLLSVKILDALNRGKNLLGEEATADLSNFIKSQMLPDQSFMDKSGKSDVYYTLFGWMLCWILNINQDNKKMKNYLLHLNEEELDLVHYTAFKRCELIRSLMNNGKLITGIRTVHGQKMKQLTDFKLVPHNDTNAPYTQFIWMTLQEDTGNKNKDWVNTIKSLSAYKAENGGYLNTKDGVTATTNATVAALSIIGQLSDYHTSSDVYYLKDLQKESGGFAAAESSPVPDLLSTATALFTLYGYQQRAKFSAMNFIEAHWSESGGFVATILDDKSDVEYCFYGLLALGCA